MARKLSEQQIEQTALGWFEALGFDIRKGADISPGSDTPLRERYEQSILEPRLHTALRRINRHLPEDAIEPEPTLSQNNRWFHRLLTDGIDIEYRAAGGETRGDKAWLANFADPGANDWLMANQFTVKGHNSTRRVVERSDSKSRAGQYRGVRKLS